MILFECIILIFNKIYELSSAVLANSQDPNDEVPDDMDSMHAKSRHVLKRLKAGTIPFWEGLKYKCPFCGRRLSTLRHSLLQHAEGVGKNGGRSHQPHTKAKHAAFFVFLMKYEFVDS